MKNLGNYGKPFSCDSSLSLSRDCRAVVHASFVLGYFSNFRSAKKKFLAHETRVDKTDCSQEHSSTVGEPMRKFLQFALACLIFLVSSTAEAQDFVVDFTDADF